jgi:hypothetical protein
MTKRLEGTVAVSGHGSLYQTCLNLNFLDTKLREAVDKSAREVDTSYYRTAVRFGREKLTSYWQKLILDPPVSYPAVATFLHPSFRLHWFQQAWREHDRKWIAAVSHSIKSVYEIYEELIEEEQAVDQQDESILHRHPQQSGDDYLATLYIDTNFMTGANSRQKRARTGRTNEISRYQDSLTVALINGQLPKDPLKVDPIAWWQKEGKVDYPVLYRMALDFLSVPSTSCECERAFSSARRTVTDDRNSLSASTIEAIQLQRNWINRHAVQSNLKALGAQVDAAEGGSRQN